MCGQSEQMITSSWVVILLERKGGGKEKALEYLVYEEASFLVFLVRKYLSEGPKQKSSNHC